MFSTLMRNDNHTTNKLNQLQQEVTNDRHFTDDILGYVLGIRPSHVVRPLSQMYNHKRSVAYLKSETFFLFFIFLTIRNERSRFLETSRDKYNCYTLEQIRRENAEH